MGLVFIIFGATLILLGGGFVLASHFVGRYLAGLEERCTVSAEAELVDKARRSTEYSEKIEVTYHGVYSFVTEDGVHVQAENKSGYSRPEEIPGPVIAIRYNPDNLGEFLLPEEQARIDEINILPGLRRSGIAMLIAGVPLLIVGIVLWFA